MILAVIQAHTGSTRLPRKVLEKIGYYTMLDHVIKNVKRAKLIDKVVVATSEVKGNDEICRIAEKWQVPWFKGSESEVIDRFHKAAEEYEADIVVRICSDCPLISPNLIDLCIRIFEQGGYDYFGNPMYPDGLDVEVFSFKALEEAWTWALGEDREHVTSWIRENDKFKVGYLKDIKLSVDEPEDLNFIREILKR